MTMRLVGLAAYRLPVWSTSWRQLPWRGVIQGLDVSTNTDLWVQFLWGRVADIAASFMWGTWCEWDGRVPASDNNGAPRPA